MTNLIGGDEDWLALMTEPGAIPHIYGKREARPGRKMGHVTRLKSAQTYPRGNAALMFFEQAKGRLSASGPPGSRASLEPMRAQRLAPCHLKTSGIVGHDVGVIARAPTFQWISVSASARAGRPDDGKYIDRPRWPIKDE